MTDVGGVDDATCEVVLFMCLVLWICVDESTDISQDHIPLFKISLNFLGQHVNALNLKPQTHSGNIATAHWQPLLLTLTNVARPSHFDSRWERRAVDYIRFASALLIITSLSATDLLLRVISSSGSGSISMLGHFQCTHTSFCGFSFFSSAYILLCTLSILIHPITHLIDLLDFAVIL